MEGRAVAKSGWHHGGRRLYRKSGSVGGGQARRPFSSQLHERETNEGERGGDELAEKDNEKILPLVGVSALREESTEEVVEEPLRGPVADREEWKRKGGWGRLPESIIVNDDEEDGVHGDRMKPLASFDLNRDMPPPQTRKLRIKLSSPDADQPPTMDGVAAKATRRAQDKENRGLVPLCPGTTQIRGMKRKTVSPTDIKAHGGGKRHRPPLGSGPNATEQLRTGPVESFTPSPVEELEKDDSRGMDILLMALKAADEKDLEGADRNCQPSITASVPLAKPTVVHTTDGEKAPKNPRPTMKVLGATTANLHLKQDKVDSKKQDDRDSRWSDEDEDEDESEYMAYPVRRPHRIKMGNGPSVPAPWTLKPKVSDKFKKDESSCSDEDSDCPEGLDYPVMRPHRIKMGNGPSVPAPWTLKPKDKFKKEPSCSDEDSDCPEGLDYPVMRPHRIKIGNGPSVPAPWTLKPKDKFKTDESSCSDEDSDRTEVLQYPVMRPHRIKIGNGPSVPAPWTLKRSASDKFRKEESSGSDGDPECAEDSSRKFGAGPKGCSKTSQEALDNCKKKLGVSKEDEEQITTAVDGAKGECKAKNDVVLERGGNGVLSDENVRELRQYQSAATTGIEEEEEMQQEFEARDQEEAAPSCSDDDDLVEYAVRKPHRYRPAPPKEAFSKSANLLDGRKENRGGKISHDGDKNETVIRPQLCKMHPSQVRVAVRTQTGKDGIRATSCHADEEDDEPNLMKPQNNKPLPPPLIKVVLSEEQNFNKRALKECKSTGPFYSIAVESDHHHQQQQKVLERRETSGHDRVKGNSQLGEEGSKVEEKCRDRNRERNDFPQHLTGTKYPPGSRQQQSAWKESSGGGAKSASDQQPWKHTKKRKSSDHMSACFIVPKQVKLATASCLVETGEPAQPSVGPVVVECIPAPTELQKEDNSRAPFGELQNRDAVWSYNPLQLSHPKSAKDEGGICDTDKENRSSSSKGTTASDCPSSAGPTQVVKVGGNSNTIGGSVSGNSLHSVQNLRINSGPDSQFVNVTYPQQQRFTAALGAGSIARNTGPNEDNEARHEIAGITVQRRSWEALKSAEFFAKRMFDPKPAESADENKNYNVPSVPSRFQEYHDGGQGVSNSKPKTNFGTSHFTHENVAAALSAASVCVKSNHAVLGQKKVTYRRGPYKQGGNKHERLRRKVLNRNLEFLVQLKEARCLHEATDFSRVHPVQNGAHDFPANGCYNSSQHLPRSYSHPGFPKSPTTLKTRQRRGQKKLEKEKLKAINVKTSSNLCKFKPLLEPSGLLGDFNPGIIQKVRNSVQIHAILGALIRAASCNSSLPKVPPQDSARAPPTLSKEAEGQLKEKPVVVLGPLMKEEDSSQAESTPAVNQETLDNEERSTQAKATVQVHETLQAQECLIAVGASKEEQVPQAQRSGLREETLDHEGELLRSNAEQSEPPAMPSQLHQCLAEKEGLASLKDSERSGLAILKDDDVSAEVHEHSEALLTQELPSIVSDNSEHAVEDSEEQELHPMSGTDSPPTAAGLAGRWLELLTLDIKGRLSALKQSRRRVQSTLQSEQLNPDNGRAAVNPPSTTRSAIDSIDVLGSQQSVSSDATAAPQTNTQDESSSRQVDRWRALFANMDGVLGTEATKLESWLWQIKQMQAFCPGSIQLPFSAPGEKSDVAASCEVGLATSNLGFEKLQPAERWPLSLETMEKELWIRRIGCFDNVQS